MGAVGLTGIGSGEELVQILRKTWSAGIGRGNGHLALKHGALASAEGMVTLPFWQHTENSITSWSRWAKVLSLRQWRALQLLQGILQLPRRFGTVQ
jgi:hypothetical protein